MIVLTFHDRAGKTPASAEATGVRIIGGALSNDLHQGVLASYEDVLASYTAGMWRHRGCSYPQVLIRGASRMLFGISRDPTFVSDPVEAFSLIGPTLLVERTPIAQYVEEQDTWHSLARPMSWAAMRIISTKNVSAFIDESGVTRLNLWEPLPQSHDQSERPTYPSPTDEPTIRFPG